MKSSNTLLLITFAASSSVVLAEGNGTASNSTDGSVLPVSAVSSAMSWAESVPWSPSTTVVTAYTTYCPEPTTFTQGNHTYVVTEATTLTITDCPCTLTHVPTVTPVPPIHNATSPVAPPVHNGTTTEGETVWTTYCPTPTTFSYGNSTYYVTAPVTLTIAKTSSHVIPPAGTAPAPIAPPAGTPVAPVESASAHTSVATANGANSVAAGVGAIAAAAAMLFV